MTDVYFSVDVEADGPIPGDYSMSSFGVVACAFKNGTEITLLDIDQPDNTFYAELKPISSNWVPEAAAVAGFDRQELIKSAQDPAEALKAFAAWVEATTQRIAPGGRAIFVGWPLSYDWMWIYWYLMKYNGSSPFGFSGAIDMKSWYSAKTGLTMNKVNKRMVYKALKQTPRKHTHNALDDAKEQGELWQHLVAWRP